MKENLIKMENTKMRILHIVEAFEGGMFAALQTVVNGMGEHHQVYIMYTMRNGTPENYKQMFRQGTRFIKSRYLTREFRPLQDMRAYAEVRRVVREVKPDVVHCHSSKAGAIGRLALNGRRIPILYSPQGYSFLMYDTSRVKRFIYFVMEKLLGLKPSLTVAVSAGEYESAKRVSRRACYINNGIQTAELDRYHLDIEHRPEKMTVCTLGRIAPQKNPAMFNQIAERFPDTRFIWIGGGELADRLTSPNIEITGWLPKDKALETMMDASVFLLPSLYEGFAISILEAMYLKRLCVVSKIPGNVDAIENGTTGFVCDALEDYVRVLERVKRKGINMRMLSAARERIKLEFNQEVMALNYENVYQAEIDRIGKKTGGLRQKDN